MRITERRLVLVSLIGALFFSLAMAALGFLFGLRVPQEVYLIGTAAFGSLAALIRDPALRQPRRRRRLQGASPIAPVPTPGGVSGGTGPSGIPPRTRR